MKRFKLQMLVIQQVPQWQAEDNLEMSAFQKQLMLKRTNRVGLKQKKILAMMEEETLIDDPSSKPVKLLKHRKLEVCV